MHPFENGAAFEAAWEELCQRHGESLRRRVGRLLKKVGVEPDQDQVEERVQEVYCRLLVGGGPRIKRLQKWKAVRVHHYLGKVAQRVVLDEVRARTAVKRGGGLRFIGRVADFADHAIDPRGTPEELAMLEEARRQLLRVCRAFTESQAQAQAEERRRNYRVLRLALLEGWSSHEIARAEGGRLAASSVDTLVYRLRQRLRRSGFGLPSR